MTTHTQKGSLEVKGEWCQGMLYPQAFAVESMGGSWDAQNMDCEPGKSEWLAKGNLKEMSHKSNSNCHKDVTQQHGLWVHLCVHCQSVQALSCVRFFATPWTAAHQASLSVTNLLKLGLLSYGAYSNSCPLSRWCHPTISPSVVPLLPPSIFPSIRVFSNESVLHTRWPRYWSFSFSFSISPSNEYSELISCTIDRLDLLAVQGTLKGLLQHYISKASLLQCLAFFIVSH